MSVAILPTPHVSSSTPAPERHPRVEFSTTKRRPTSSSAKSAPDDRRAALREAGARLVEAGDDRVDLDEGFAALEAEDIDRLMIEGGGEILFSTFEADLVDELSVFLGSLVIGGREAPTLADGTGFVENFPELALEDVERLDDGVLCRYTIE